MLERISALRIDLGQGTMREVEVDEYGNWQSNEGGVITTHIEGEIGEEQQKGGIYLCVEYDIRDPYPYPHLEGSYISGKLPPRRRAKLLIWNSGAELVDSLLIYDARWRDHHPPPVDEKGNPQSISLS
ncbi:hypothetical protein A3D81_01805 [Candidatus Curtissbacteria bacterium RIFCSPHIGHO2_02_FULL_40_17]|uniref:Uncharacterized protein n=3 Tax=Candidatus Curtissiibacteriota TaxID=1752717 RepID=A0A1F5GG76_9BACT|nr:MAG: hypothetical protein A3D81_01805 [Candidatus Curtissbacteria bacterium RIFCSPHIGHO2_02_FULL_40_17]OGE05757.1 MAG: hypothetical protein A3F45_04095 [Candidatus Curtissbacteria bacterium RIFCSPHIGHO2_12_FULL_41_17]OGE08771.1 MAG: hypothetical protein A3I53_00215 [Candidatus Curtissbacteria bacterium RIFCSPLOWO2_02_FULL_40_13b]